MSKFNSLLIGRGSVFKNFFALGILQGTNFLIPLIIMPYLISTIGYGGYGIVSFIQAVMVYFYSFTDYGFAITATRQISLHRDNTAKISEIFSTVIFTKLLLVGLSACITSLLVFVVPQFEHEKLAFLLGFSIVIGQSVLPIWFFQGVEKMKYITYINLGAKIVFTILIFVFVKEKNDYPLVLLFFGVGNLISGVIGVFYARKQFNLVWKTPTTAKVVQELKDGWGLFLANFSVVSYMNSNLFILGLFTTSIITGYYSVAEKVIMAIRQLLSVFSQAIFPHICKLTSEGITSIVLFYKQIFIPFIIAITIISTGIFFFADSITLVLTKTENTEITGLIRLMSIVPIIVGLNIPAFQTMLAYDLKRSYTRIAIFGSCLNIVLNLLLASSLQAVGTAYSVIITEIFITAGLYIIFQAKHKAELQ